MRLLEHATSHATGLKSEADDSGKVAPVGATVDTNVGFAVGYIFQHSWSGRALIDVIGRFPFKS